MWDVHCPYQTLQHEKYVLTYEKLAARNMLPYETCVLPYEKYVAPKEVCVALWEVCADLWEVCVTLWEVFCPKCVLSYEK